MLCEEPPFMHFPALTSARIRRAVSIVMTLIAALGLHAPSQAAGDGPPAAPPGCTGPASQTWLGVVVEGVRDAKGQIAITLYPDDSSRFLVHNGSLYVGRTPAIAGTTRGCIFLPKPGVYVVAIYHDENGNGSFDRSSLGLPIEAYGFSNNPATLLGLPSFRSIRLNAARSGLTTHIQLHYP
jgi:uncharacterized protein (DUF2141 family)